MITTFPALEIDINDYPAVKEFLEGFKPKLIQEGKNINEDERKSIIEHAKKYGIDLNKPSKLKDLKKSRKKTGNKWFETQDQIAYYEEFEKEKIVWQRITQKPTFCVSSAGEYILDSMAFLSGFSLNNGKYIVAILNSKLVEFWVDKSVHQYGTTGYRLANQYVEQIPIPPIPEPDQQPFIDPVDTILAKKERGEDTSKEEFEIDMRVYELYGLTDEEIKVVDPEFEAKRKKFKM